MEGMDDPLQQATSSLRWSLAHLMDTSRPVSAPSTAPKQNRVPPTMQLPRDSKDLLSDAPLMEAAMEADLRMYYAQMRLNPRLAAANLEAMASANSLIPGSNSQGNIDENYTPWHMADSRKGSDPLSELSEIQEMLDRHRSFGGVGTFGAHLNHLRTASHDFKLENSTRSLNSNNSFRGAGNNMLTVHHEDGSIDGWSRQGSQTNASQSPHNLSRLFEGAPLSPSQSFSQARTASNASSIWADPPMSAGNPIPTLSPSSSRIGGTSGKNRVSEPSKLRTTSKIAPLTSSLDSFIPDAQSLLEPMPLSTLNGGNSSSHMGAEESALQLTAAAQALAMQAYLGSMPPAPPPLQLNPYAVNPTHLFLPPQPQPLSMDPMGMGMGMGMDPMQAYYTMHVYLAPNAQSYDPSSHLYASLMHQHAYGGQGSYPISPAGPPPPPPSEMNPASAMNGNARKAQQQQFRRNEDVNPALTLPFKGTSSKPAGGSGSYTADPLLEEFKANGMPSRVTISEISGHFYEFSKDQYGSRHLQQKLETCTTEDISTVLNELLPPIDGSEPLNLHASKILQLMTDVFGNYVVQKLIEKGLLSHRQRIASALKGHVLNMSLQMYGCRVVQKCIETLPLPGQLEILAEMDSQVMRCVQDSNGNHVIQKIIECIPNESVLHILDKFLTCVLALCMHPYGCRVIQRVLEYCHDVERRARFMEVILKSTCQLAEDQYGNYVTQHVVEHGTNEERLQIISMVAPKIVLMSMHKFASNVVEKCLIYGSVDERDKLVQSMLGQGSPPDSALDSSSDGQDPFQRMMIDQYGNYVVQRVLEVCDDTQRALVMSHVRTQTEALKKFTYGKHILARVDKLLATGMKLQNAGALPIPSDSQIDALIQRRH